MSFLTADVFNNPHQTMHLDADFVAEYMHALGVRTEPRGPSLLRAELTREQLCELENRPATTWYAMNNLPDLSTIYLTTDTLHDTSAEGAERAESAAMGSWRFDLMRDSASRIGAVTRLRVLPEGTAEPLIYRPILIFGFEVLYRCSRHKAFLLPVAVDLVSGASGRELALALLSRKMDEGLIRREAVRRRELRYKHAFEIGCEWVKDYVTEDQATWDWYYRASYRLNIELEQVNAYCAERLRDGEANLEKEREHLVMETKRRFKPRVEARPSLGIIAFCPENELPEVGR